MERFGALERGEGRLPSQTLRAEYLGKEQSEARVRVLRLGKVLGDGGTVLWGLVRAGLGAAVGVVTGLDVERGLKLAGGGAATGIRGEERGCWGGLAVRHRLWRRVTRLADAWPAYWLLALSDAEGPG